MCKVILKVTVKVTLFHGCFFHVFLNCTNATKLRKGSLVPNQFTCIDEFLKLPFLYLCIDFYVSQNSFYLWKLCRGKAQVLLFCWLLPLLVQIDAAALEVIMTLFSRYNKNNFCDNWRYHHKNKFYCAIRRWKRNISHFFKENVNKWVLHTRKKTCAKMSSKLYCSKFYNKNVPYFNIKLTCFT